MIRRNEHGGLIIRQSDLGSYNRCPQQKHLYDVKEAAGERGENLSATVFGTVVHHALQIMETLHHEGRKDALDVALATFLHYWHPDNIGELEPGGVDVWLPRETYGGLRARGQEVLKIYYDELTGDTGQLLALEYTFAVPLFIPGDDRQHTLTGTVDRLASRKVLRKPALTIEDFKTGKAQTYLRWNMQFTAYAWASTQPRFWDGFDDPERAFATTKDWARRTYWLDMKTVTRKDAGWRSEQDYARLMVALREYIRAVELEVYPLNMKGDVCLYCPFSRNGDCGGVPIPDEKDGAP